MKFETPVVEVKKFDVRDALTTSALEPVDPPDPDCPENTETPCFDD